MRQVLDSGNVAGPTGLVGRMARFTDGPDHATRRAAVAAVLPGCDGLRAAAAERTAALAVGVAFDVMPIATKVPVAVLAEAIGVVDVEAAVRLTAELCATRSDAAAEALMAVVGGLDAVSVLFQTRDATAALIAAAVIEGGVAAAISALPVHSTQRDGAWVSLAEVGTFGAGRHACPGAAQAVAIAEGVLDGLGPVRVVGDVVHEPRPNLRLPVRLEVAR